MGTGLKAVLKAVAPKGLLAAWQVYRKLPQRVDWLEKQARLASAAQAHDRFASVHQGDAGLSAWNRHELKVYSQNGEDGLLLHLFDQIGVELGRFVEFGIGHGDECNTANLSLHFGWQGRLFDCEAEKVAAARAFYRRRLGPRADGIRIEAATIDRDNVNTVLRPPDGDPVVDLLSIDIDGNDYWVWEALDVLAPRAVVVEYNAVFGPERACTTHYDPRFNRWAKHPSGLYFGASLAALEKLGRSKGYRLVGCDSHGVNAFFVRQDLAPEVLPAQTPAEAYFPLQDRLLGWIDETRLPEISHLPLVDV